MSKTLKDEVLKKDKKPPADVNHESHDESHGNAGKDTSGRKEKDEPDHHEDTFHFLRTLENTYQLGPYKRFPVPAVTEILRDVLTSHLQDEKYEAQQSQKLPLTLSKIIKSRVKELEVPRYKTVVLVHVGQFNGQGVQITSSFLWDASSDTSASYCFKNSSMFCVATVYAVYFE